MDFGSEEKSVSLLMDSCIARAVRRVLSFSRRVLRCCEDVFDWDKTARRGEEGIEVWRFSVRGDMGAPVVELIVLRPDFGEEGGDTCDPGGGDIAEELS